MPWCRLKSPPLVLCALLLASGAASAQATGEAGAAQAPPAQAQAPELIGEVTWSKAALFAGGFVGALALHESGHLVSGLSLGVHPRIAPVWFLGFVPFFAIDSRIACSGRVCTQDGRPFNGGQVGAAVIFSAGFQVQHLADELILSLAPDLRSREAPFSKGMLAFNTLTSIGYVIANWAGIEPYTGDLAAMNRFTRVPCAVSTGLLLSTAAIDLLRFWYPGAPALPWVGRAIKVAFAGSVVVF